MVTWFILGELIAISVAIYAASYGLWVAKQKNWLGAIGVWIIALMTLTTPLLVFYLHRSW
ncbi:MAG: hypothetical protein GX295_08860 [Syntrophomonadaceae bacterium]|nr:hypothetical protein [Syntrophomonadaceae bacterium]